MTDEEKRFDRREEARLDDMYDNAPEPNDFVRGYRQGFADAKYIYDLKEKWQTQ